MSDLHITLPEPVRSTTTVNIPLAAWNEALEACLRNETYEAVPRLAKVVLHQLPRHLPTYQRLVRALWALQRWPEGEDWARRLLQADPLNALAWRAIALATEQRGRRGQANAIWRRAFECDPYEPEIRAGLQRTTTGSSAPPERILELNLACLAGLYLRGQRWERAAAAYQRLIEADPRRLDFQIGRLLALWQARATAPAYQLARQLQQAAPNLLLVWVVLDAIGDENDKALARYPLHSMDANGDYMRNWYNIPVPPQPLELLVTEEEAELLNLGF